MSASVGVSEAGRQEGTRRVSHRLSFVRLGLSAGTLIREGNVMEGFQRVIIEPVSLVLAPIWVDADPCAAPLAVEPAPAVHTAVVVFHGADALGLAVTQRLTHNTYTDIHTHITGTGTV